jgi:flavodoxin
MKKLILSLLIGCCLVAGLSAKTAFVYFSMSGNTERMAKDGAAALNADIFKIEAAQPYTEEDLNWRNKKARATVEFHDSKARPEIANKIDISDYDTVIVCYPIWFGNAPKIMFSFVESQNWDGKTLITLCTSHQSGIGKSGKGLAKYAKGAAYKGGTDLAKATSEDIKSYIERILSGK